MIDVELDKIITELKVTPEEFSNAIGVAKSSIYKLLGGDTKKLTKQMATKINKAYPQYSYEHLRLLNKGKNNTIEPLFDKVYLNKGSEKISIDEIYKFIIENENEILANKSFKIWISEKVYKGMVALSNDSRLE